MSLDHDMNAEDPSSSRTPRDAAWAMCPGCMKEVPPGVGYCPFCGFTLGTWAAYGTDDPPSSPDGDPFPEGGVDSDGPVSRPLGFGAVVAVWVIFAPTAVFAAYAFAMWSRHLSGTMRSLYAVGGAAFCAIVFGAPVVGVTMKYFAARRRRS